MPDETIKLQIKETLIDELMLEESPSDIDDTAPIFGPEGLGLDSVDALQIVVALQRKFGLKLADADAAREVLQSIDRIAQEVIAFKEGSEDNG